MVSRALSQPQVAGQVIYLLFVDTADVCRFVRYGLAAFFVFILFVFWPYGFIWLSLFFFVVNLVLPYG